MKKNLKGLTLVEIIISFAVFAIMALMIASIMAVSSNARIDTSRLNGKIDNQAVIIDQKGPYIQPVGANDLATNSTITIDSKTVNVTYYEIDKNASGNEIPNIKVFKKRP